VDDCTGTIVLTTGPKDRVYPAPQGWILIAQMLILINKLIVVIGKALASFIDDP
jgi:hypothetical protein